MTLPPAAMILLRAVSVNLRAQTVIYGRTTIRTLNNDIFKFEYSSVTVATTTTVSPLLSLRAVKNLATREILMG